LLFKKIITMKNLSKIIAAAFISASLFFTFIATAQTTPPPPASTSPSPLQVNFGLEGGLPTGAETAHGSFAVGATLQLEDFASRNFAITLTSGDYYFFSKDIPGTTVKYATLNIIPVKAGIKAFFSPNVYFGAEAGAAFISNGNVKFLASPALGFTSDDKAWDVSIRYENYSGVENYGIVGLRLAHSL
jgi:hypothetical protein